MVLTTIRNIPSFTNRNPGTAALTNCHENLPLFQARTHTKSGNFIVSHYPVPPFLAPAPFAARPVPPRAQKRQFTHDEDKVLREAVAKHGQASWDKVAAELSGRTPRQCRDRWNKYLSPDLRNSMWTDEEDARLLDLIEKVGPKWSRLKSYFMGRSDINIKNRYKYLMARGNEAVPVLRDDGDAVDLDLQLDPPTGFLATRQLSPEVVEQAQRYNQDAIAALDRLFRSLGPVRPRATSQITTKL